MLIFTRVNTVNFVHFHLRLIWHIWLQASLSSVKVVIIITNIIKNNILGCSSKHNIYKYRTSNLLANKISTFFNKLYNCHVKPSRIQINTSIFFFVKNGKKFRLFRSQRDVQFLVQLRSELFKRKAAYGQNTKNSSRKFHFFSWHKTVIYPTVNFSEKVTFMYIQEQTPQSIGRVANTHRTVFSNWASFRNNKHLQLKGKTPLNLIHMELT